MLMHMPLIWPTRPPRHLQLIPQTLQWLWSARMKGGRPALHPHSNRYRYALDGGWEDLQAWLRSSGLAASYLHASVSRSAAVLPQYVRDRYQQRASRSTVTYALLAAQRRLHASRLQLKESWELAWEWRAGGGMWTERSKATCTSEG